MTKPRTTTSSVGAGPLGGWRRAGADGARALDVRTVLDSRTRLPDRIYRLVSAPDIGDEARYAVPYAVTTALRAMREPTPDPASGGSNVWRTVSGRGLLPARASTAADIVLALAHQIGPVVLGLHWRDGLDHVDTRTGIARYAGSRLGGHAVTLVGVKQRGGLVRVVNVWGVRWGQLGRAWLGVDALEDILDDGGEACVVLRAVDL